MDLLKETFNQLQDQLQQKVNEEETTNNTNNADLGNEEYTASERINHVAVDATNGIKDESNKEIKKLEKVNDLTTSLPVRSESREKDYGGLNDEINRLLRELEQLRSDHSLLYNSVESSKKANQYTILFKMYYF